MAKFWMKKRLDQSLEPADDDARGYLKRLKVGADVQVEVKRPRNVQFHRKWFAMARVVFDNQDIYEDFHAFRRELTMRAGWWEEHVHLSGAISYTAKSIAFDKMDQDQFEKMYDKSITVAIENFIPGTDREDLENAVMEFA